MRSRYAPTTVLPFLSWLVIIAALFTILMHAFGVSFMTKAWDDSYMSFRYAHNILAHGVFAWNGTIPTFGVTSLAQISLIVPLAALWHNPTAVVTTVSIVEMLVFLALVPFLVTSIIPKTDMATRRIALAASFVFIALGNPDFGVLAASGMDTMLDLTFVSLYFIVLLRAYPRLQSISPIHRMLIGVLGGCAFLVRPDLLVFTILIPVCLALWSQDKAARKNAWLIVGSTALTLGAILLCTWAYFGTALPLSFFAKSGGHLFGPRTVAIQKFQPILQFLAFVNDYKFLFAAFAVTVFLNWRRIFTRGEHAILVGMIGSVVTFILYYLLFVLQYMGYFGRFYYPVLPVLLALLCMLLVRVFGALTEGNAGSTRRLVAIGACVVLFALLYTPFAWGAEQLGYAWQQRAEAKIAWTEDIPALYHWGTDYSFWWPCLDVWAALPDDALVATTEIGMPSVIAPEKTVVDLSGLQSNGIALGHLSRVRAILDSKADLVYLPTEQYYPEMREELLTSAAFTQRYDLFFRGITEQQDLAVLKSSPYAKTLEQCIAKEVPQGGAEYPPLANTYYISLPYPLTLPY